VVSHNDETVFQEIWPERAAYYLVLPILTCNKKASDVTGRASYVLECFMKICLQAEFRSGHLLILSYMMTKDH
jgi:hypothetical protein